MKILTLILAVFSFYSLTGCGPLAAVGAVGSTITRTMADDDPQPVSREQIRSINADEIAEANLNLGIEYMRVGDYENALIKLSRAKAAKPNYSPVYDAYGILYQQLGQFEKAEDNFKYAIKLDGSNSNTLNNYGQFLCNQNREDEAEKYFMAAAENPFYETPEIPYSNIGTCAYMQNNVDKAINYFEKALSINPALPPALIQMSEIDYKNGQYISAQKYLNRYLQYTVHSPKSLWLGIRIGQELEDKNTVSSYALLLRNQYPESAEAQYLSESGIR